MTTEQLLKELETDNAYFSQKVIYACVNGGEVETEYSSGFKDPNFMELVELDFLMPDKLLLTPQIEVELRSKGNSSLKYSTVVPIL